MSQQQRLSLATVVVDGPIALHTRRLLAAQRGEVGLQVLRMEQMAARLAGGFLRPASSEDLDVAVRTALAGGGFNELENLSNFPGATRAVSRTLRRTWEAGVSLPDLAACSPRAADLLLLEQRVRAGLPVGSLSPPDLVLAAKRRVGLAGRLLGAVEFASLPYVAPVWQDSVSVLAEHTRVFWSGPAPPGGERPWSSRLPVPVPGTDLVFGGSIDRLDIRADGAVQVTDYKTGKVPKKHGTMVLDGGRELQRVLYALAARTLLPEVRSTRARLAFLQSDPADLAVLHNVEDAIASTSSHLRAAAKSLLEGVSLPGPDTEDEWSARLLALPAAGSGYSNLKRAAFSKAFHHLRQAWLAR